MYGEGAFRRYAVTTHPMGLLFPSQASLKDWNGI